MKEREHERVIGSWGQGEPGPLLFFLGGIHGNEPAGVIALERVFATLTQHKIPIKGKIIGLRGNCQALAAKKRYIDRDLNRLWSDPEIARVKALPPAERNVEEKELVELLRFFEAAFKSDYGPQIFVDLHTTSAPGGLFSITTDDKANRELAEALRVPIIFNLVDELALTTNVYFKNRGINGIAFESGQHDDPASIDIHEAAIWVLLVACQALQPEQIPDYAQYPARLKGASESLDEFLWIAYRHPITPQDQFAMNPGYANFQSIQKGELLGQDQGGEIRASVEGKILMPLYQPQGEDGFFIMQPIDQPPI
ncbi:MAG: succinylglutamate desuccinylase/aspartoacylase family protein [Bacteroidota bacterium]